MCAYAYIDVESVYGTNTEVPCAFIRSCFPENKMSCNNVFKPKWYK